MKVTRREFLRFGLGGAATMLTAAAAPLLSATEAYAIAGVDDAVLGGVVLVMLTLSGYVLSEALTSTSMSEMGYDFSSFAQDSRNQSAAVTRAIADANNLGVQVSRQNAEDAAAAIAAGTGAAGQWFAGIAESGRIALDGWLSGIGANQAALWGLVDEFRASVLSSTYGTAASSASFAADSGNTIGDLGMPVRVTSLENLLAPFAGETLPIVPYYAIRMSGRTVDYLWIYGEGQMPYIRRVGTGWNCYTSNGSPWYEVYRFNNRVDWYTRANGFGWQDYYGYPIVSDLCVTGGLLPGVDKAADAPETYGAGYDKTVLGNDLVIDPATGDVVSAGTIALPVDYPYVQLPYVDGLYQQGAGVVTGLYDLPISGDTNAVVGTGEGVASMPISQAISAETSLAEVATPVDPVVPPGTPDVGPWTPAYDLPFYEVWPFNMIYSFVSALSELGGE